MRVRPVAVALTGLLAALAPAVAQAAPGPLEGVTETRGCALDSPDREFVLVPGQGRTHCYTGSGLTRPGLSDLRSWQSGRYAGYLRYQDEGIQTFIRFQPNQSGRLDLVGKVLELRLERG